MLGTITIRSLGNNEKEMTTIDAVLCHEKHLLTKNYKIIWILVGTRSRKTKIIN